jgi:hypothetical protein
VLRVILLLEEVFGVITIGVLLQPPNGTVTLRVEKFRLPKAAVTLTVILPLL